MKKLEEEAPFTAEVDDFKSERKEVLKKQGPRFPYTYGFWLLCQLVADINPDDLDAMDESLPFTRKTMNELLGRKLTCDEYEWYFKKHSAAGKFRPQLEQFKRDDVLARDLFMLDLVLYSATSVTNSSKHKLAEVAKEHNHIPVLTKGDKGLYLYGPSKNEKEWKLNNLPTEIRDVLDKFKLKFPKIGKKPRILKANWDKKDIYLALAEIIDPTCITQSQKVSQPTSSRNSGNNPPSSSNSTTTSHTFFQPQQPQSSGSSLTYST